MKINHCILSIAHCLLLFFVALTSAHSAESKASLAIYAPAAPKDATLELRTWEDFVSNRHRESPTSLVSENDGGYFHFTVDSIPGFVWIDLHFPYQRVNGEPRYGLLERYLLQPGDSIVIHMEPRLGRHVAGRYENNLVIMEDNWYFRFSGRGSAKFAARWQVDVALREAYSTNTRLIADPNLIQRGLEFYDTLLNEAVAIVQEHAETIDDDILQLMIAEIHGDLLNRKMAIFWRELWSAQAGKIKRDQLVKPFKTHFISPNEWDSRASFSSMAHRSPTFAHYLYFWAESANFIATGKYRIASIYQLLVDSIRNIPLKQRAVVFGMLFRFPTDPTPETLEQARNLVSSQQFLVDALETLGNSFQGMDAFPFALPDIDNKIYRLTDFRGKVVFMDFWFMACIPCRHFMDSVLKPVVETFRDNKDVVFLTVSIDRLSVFNKAVETATFLPDDAINLYTDDRRSNHPLIKHYAINGYPYPLLIGKDGKITANKKTLRSADDVITAIRQALQ